MNRVFLLGRAQQAPVVRATRDGQLIAQLTVITTDRYQLPDGSWKASQQFHNVIAYGDHATYARVTFKAGDPVLLEGRIRMVFWPEKHGGGKRSKTEIVLTMFHPISTLRELLPDTEDAELNESPLPEPALF